LDCSEAEAPEPSSEYEADAVAAAAVADEDADDDDGDDDAVVDCVRLLLTSSHKSLPFAEYSNAKNHWSNYRKV